MERKASHGTLTTTFDPDPNQFVTHRSLLSERSLPPYHRQYAQMKTKLLILPIKIISYRNLRGMLPKY
jgi:hypothetical protein